MPGLVLRNAEPVFVIGVRQALKSPAGIECKIDRVVLDVRDSMNECCAPLDGTQRALRHIMRMNQQRPWRPARYRARIGIRRPGHCALELGKIGRASGRESVWQCVVITVVAASLIQKLQKANKNKKK